MTANPVELIGGLASNVNVSKADIISWAKARVPQVFASVAEMRNTILAGQLVVYLRPSSASWYLDVADTTTPDDGVNCIVSSDGFRFKQLSNIVAPTTGSLGGVFAKAATAHLFVTGLDAAGNLLRAQPAAADLSDGTTGSDAVVLSNAPSLASPTLVTPNIGDATATSVNKVTITAPATGATLTVDNGKTLRASVTVTFAGTDGTTMTFPGSSQTLAGLTAAQTLTNKTIDTPALTGTVDIQQAVTMSGDISPPQITADINDYAPTGFGTASVIRLSTDASRNVTGLAGGADGRLVFILNAGSFGVVLKDESASSTVANRFGFGADLTLSSKQGATLLYDAPSTRWRQVGGPSASGGGSGTVTTVATDDSLSGGPITTSGTLALADKYRQNILLDRVYQSKLMGLNGVGGYRRVVNSFADGFCNTDGILASSSSNYTMDNIVGIVAPGAAVGANASTSGFAISSTAVTGSAGQTADGTTTGANGYISNETSAGVSGVSYVGQNFGAGNTKHIRQFTIWQGYNSDVTYSVSSVKVQYSDNGTTWTDLTTAALTATTAAQTVNLPASAAHQYWRLLANSAPGAANRWGMSELQMSESQGVANMTVVTTPQTTDSAVSVGRVLLEFDNGSSPTLNTDLTAEMSFGGLTATVTISNASPGVISHTAHGMAADDPVSFSTSGALPTGLTAATTYFVKSPTTNAYNVAATPGGTAINTSSAGSGTHTANFRRWTAGTLSTATSNSQGGRKVVETGEISATSGSSFEARVKTINGKSVPVYGIAVLVR
jgi:hypothetical protein